MEAQQKDIILVGSGLIAKALAWRSLSLGHQVVILTRHPETIIRSVPGNATLVKWDGRSKGDWVSHLENAKAVINLAGEPFYSGRWTKRKKHRIHQSRLDATRALLEGVRNAQRRPEVFMQGSSICYYSSQGEDVIDESGERGQSYLAQMIGTWEKVVDEAEITSVRRMILRNGIVLSEKGGVLPKLILPYKFFIGGPLGNGEQWVSWVHLDDVVRAVQFLIQHETAAGTFNVTAPAPVRSAGLAGAIGQAMDRSAIISAPERLLRGILGDMAEIFLEGQRAIPKRLLKLGFEFRFSDILSAMRTLLKE